MAKRSRMVQLAMFSLDGTERWRGAVRRSSSSRKPSPAPRPWEAVVIGVDTARTSGWSTWCRDVLAEHGELDCRDADAIREVISGALLLASAKPVLPCVLVLEAPWGGSAKVVAALGAARECWEREWRDLAEGHRGKIVHVTPSTWRASVLGAYYASAKREECRGVEMSMALGMTGSKRELGADQAAGICIGYYATRAGDVGLLLGQRAKKRSLQAWTGAR